MLRELSSETLICQNSCGSHHVLHEDLSSRPNSSIYSNAYRRQKKSYQVFSSYRRKALQCLEINQATRSYRHRRSTHTFFWSWKSKPSQTEIYKLATSKSCPHWECLYSAEWMNPLSFFSSSNFSHRGIFKSISLSCSFSSHLSNSNSCF